MVFIRGEDKNYLVPIFLHGGPDEPILGMSSSRNLEAELQRGISKSSRQGVF
jgi:hypothetical protein